MKNKNHYPQPIALATNSNALAKQGGYAVWNVGLGWRASEQLSLQLSANNLLDKVYYRRISTGASNMYGEPRSVMLTARVKF